MSKSSKKSTINPKGSIGISGGASASYNNGTTNVNLSPAQQQAYDYAQNSFANNLGSINVFSPEVLNQLQSQVEAYKNNALKELNSLYTPMLQNVRTDAAKRFGNLDNSVFINNLGTVEKERSNAISDLVQDVEAKRNELVDEELQARYNYLNFLNNYQNQIFAQALNLATMAASNADLYGKYKNINNQSQANANNATQQMLNTALRASLSLL